MTGATLFTGFGGADLGMRDAGLEMLWGIEYDDAIAAVARENGLSVTTGDVTKVNPGDYDAIDCLHASPPCPSFSVAKAGGKETNQDIEIAMSVVRFIEHFRPKVFTLENVWGYRKSESWLAIYRALVAMGYGIGHAKLNAADYGVPQSRERMIVWAMRDGRVLPAPTPTHAKYPPKPGLFGDTLNKWIGWYEAIEDLIPDLPDSQLAPWQLKRLPEELTTLIIGENPNARGDCRTRDEPMKTIAAQQAGGLPRAVLVETNANDTSGHPIERGSDEPSGTVKTGLNHVPRAVLVDGKLGSHSTYLATAPAPAPAFTVTTSHNNRDLKATTGTRVVQMTPRCLARFQSFPDSYVLPEKRSLATKGIGNAVPPMLVQRAYQHFLSLAQS